MNYDRDESDPEPRGKYEGDEGPSGASWLSNSVIISSLPEHKIRAAIIYHRQMAILLEAELSFRLAQSNSYKPQTNSYAIGRFRMVKDQSSHSSGRNKRNSKEGGIFKGLKLSAKLRRELIKCLKENKDD